MTKKLIIISIVAVMALGVAGFIVYKNNATLDNPDNVTSVEQEIESLLAQKYNKSINEVKVTIAKQSGNYVAGSVLFGTGGYGEGGLVLAAKINNVWTIVYDGNGSIDCNKMRQEYKFPDEVLKPNYCD